MPTAQTPAPPPAPPANTPSAPQITQATQSATNGMSADPNTRRGSNSLKIDLNTPGSAGNGLAIPT